MHVLPLLVGMMFLLCVFLSFLIGAYDVAILVLKNLITFNNHIQKASLPREDVYCPTFKDEMITAGWGGDKYLRVTGILSSVSQACLPPQKCRYRGVQYHYIKNPMICVDSHVHHGRGRENGTCHGDSGGKCKIFN